VSNVAGSEVLDWLESLSNQIAHLDEYRQRVEPQLASEFNVLRYARMDEMGLSLILADLLDPKGPHGQGTRFLQCFLNRYWDERKTIDKPVKVSTEVATDRIAQRQRRIDIEVDLGDRVLAIENKPWAADQRGQIRDYLDHLKSTGRPYKLLYLAGQQGQQPSEDSIAMAEREVHVEDKVLGLTSFHEVREWLRDCLRCCENERVAMFLRDLERFVASQFSHDGVDFESKLIVEAAMASPQGISAAVQLNTLAAWDLRIRLLEQLEEQLGSAFQTEIKKNGLAGWTLAIPKPLSIKFATIEVALRPNSALKLALAFEKPNCGDCFFGIGRQTEQDHSHDEALNGKLDSVFGAGQTSPWWGWWRSFEHRYWWNDSQIWVGIIDGTLAQNIVQRLIEMLRIVDQPDFRPLFESVTSGSMTPPPDRTKVKVAALAHEIHSRNNARLISHVFAVESANWPLRRALAGRVVTKLSALIEGIAGFGEWIQSESQDLTKIYGGIGFRLSAQPEIEIHLEFQSWSCRNAIFGVCQKEMDGRSEAAAELRRRLATEGLSAGNHSPGWIWYRSLDPANWFDQPETAIAFYDGRLAQRAADQLSELVQVVERARLLDIGQVTESDSVDQG
jgi:hypothetical protein